MKSKFIKVLAVVAAVVAVEVSAFAQGTINFFTFNAGNPALGQVFQLGGVTPAGAGFLGQLWGSTSSDPLSFAAIDTPQGFSGGSGYINQGIIAVPNGAIGATYFYQLRAWNSAGGAASTWALGSSGGLATQFGQSQVIQVTLGGGTNTSPQANTFASFSLVPEPSTFALGALGIGALLVARRRK